jgi:hypothetical protein
MSDNTTRDNNEITEITTAAASSTKRGVKTKQVQTVRGKVLKSRMLGVQTAVLEVTRDCDQSVQRPGVRMRAMSASGRNMLENQ